MDQISTQSSTRRPTMAEEQQMQLASLAILHKLAIAAGGQVTIRMDDIPEKLPFQFKIVNGTAVFTALEKPRTNIVSASGAVLDRLNGKG